MNWNQQRTNEAPNPVAGNPNIAKVYLTGVYVRLSVEDGGGIWNSIPNSY